MKELLFQILFRTSEMLGTFKVFEVTTESERAACLVLMDRVRRDELNRVVGGSSIESSAFVGVEVSDRLFAVQHVRSGQLVGCTRALDARQLATLPDSVLEYGLDRIPPPLLARTGVLTRLVVLPEYRKSPAALSLFQHLFLQGVDEGFELCVLACEPGLFPLYTRLGFRPNGRCHASATGGFRIPMVMVNHDLEYLQAIRSPLAGLMTRRGVRPDSEGLAWYREMISRYGEIDPGVRAFDDSVGMDGLHHASLTAGMSPKGVEALLANAIVVPCEPGQVVLREGDGGRQIGIVVRGMLEVEAGGRLLAMLGQGEVFGELAWVLNRQRTARVVAASADTEVLLLSQRAVERIESPADQAAFWRNLARVLADRLVRTQTGRRETGALRAESGADTAAQPG